MPFQNPDLFEECYGDLHIELTVKGDPQSSKIPIGVKVSGNMLIIEAGSFIVGLGCLTLKTGKSAITAANNFIKCIRDPNGNLLWVNSDYWEEVVGTSQE